AQLTELRTAPEPRGRIGCAPGFETAGRRWIRHRDPSDAAKDELRRECTVDSGRWYWIPSAAAMPGRVRGTGRRSLGMTASGSAHLIVQTRRRGEPAWRLRVFVSVREIAVVVTAGR